MSKAIYKDPFDKSWMWAVGLAVLVWLVIKSST